MSGKIHTLVCTDRTRFKHLNCLLICDLTHSVRGFTNVIARDYHSLAYTSTAVLVWGTNYGQFGLPPSDTKLMHPTEVIDTEYACNAFQPSYFISFSVV